MFDINKITRKNIRELIPYKSAREIYKGQTEILLDANENPYDTPFNRYPDPFQSELKKLIASMKKLKTSQIFIGNGSDEVIDLLFRAFCEPKQDQAFIFTPTYGMYGVSAKINDIPVIKFKLDDNFELPKMASIKNQLNSKGLLFICSPNNPTANVFPLEKIEELSDNFSGLVVVDEAYIDFSNSKSAITLLKKIPNLIVIQTMSKAYGLAGLRLGMAFANPDIISVLNKIKPPYNISSSNQRQALDKLKNRELISHQITEIKNQRDILISNLRQIKSVVKLYPSQTNFILLIFKDARTIFKTLQNKGIIIRDRTSQIDGGLRITIGTPEQNEILIKTLKTL